MIKLAIDSLFEYTEDEKNVICIDIIKCYTKNKLNYYNIGLLIINLKNLYLKFLKKTTQLIIIILSKK